MNASNTQEKRTLSRRAFLRATGWSALGITMVACRLIPVLPTQKNPARADALGWLQVRPDGRVQVLSPVQEYGQGAITALAQIVAEELNVSPGEIDMVLPQTDQMSPVRGTFGSLAIAANARPLAEAAAALREHLRALAARRHAVDASQVADAAGGFRLPSGAVIGLGELAGGKPVILAHTADEAARLPAAAVRSLARGGEHRWVGTSQAPSELRALVTGASPGMFTGDIRLPHMAYGAVIPPPVPGAELDHASLDEARKVPGFVAGVVDRQRSFVGVVAADPWTLPAVVAAVRATWRRPPRFDQAELDQMMDVDRALGQGSLQHLVVDDGLGQKGPWDVDIRCDVPMLAHAAIEPRAAVARFGESSVEIWVGTQDAFFTRGTVAAALGMDERDVVVHSQRMGGAFGGRGGFEAVEAALLARAAKRPVKVQWSRPDEFQRGHHGPPSSHRIRARLGQGGAIATWWHAFTSGHILFNPKALAPWLQAATSLFPDQGVTRGSIPPYHLGQRRIEVTDVRLPIATGAWRGLGAAPNTFAIETAMDALARRAGADPLAFRLRHVDKRHKRLATCLRRVANDAGWQSGRRGFAIASATYKEVSYVAVVAEARASRDGSQVRIERLHCAHDCGLVVNPDRVRAQIEGNLVWALGMALKHRLTVADGRVNADYLSAFPLPTIADMPELSIALVDEAKAEPTGAGETAVTAGVAAIAAAAADALGIEPRRLPISAKPERPAGVAALGGAR